MRRVKAIAQTAGIYLLLGLTTSWAVAWGLALLPPGPGANHANFWTAPRSDEAMLGIGSSRVRFQRAQIDIASIANTSPINPHRVNRRADESPSWDVLHQLLDVQRTQGWNLRSDARLQRRNYDSGTDDARGLPFLALWCGWLDPPRPQPQIPGAIVSDIDRQLLSLTDPEAQTLPSLVGGFSIPDYVSASGIKSRRALPYMPIWSGLVLNTLFYALLFFITVRAVRTFQQARRFHRGMCPHCKYDRRFDYQTPCPECGFIGKAKSSPAR